MSETKFKVGDRVRVVAAEYDLPVGAEAVVKLVDRDGRPWIETPSYRYGACHMPHWLELIAPNTVPVRIAVCVYGDGSWLAQGASEPQYALGHTWPDTMRNEPDDRISWITAHVPLPEQPAEVEGEVE